MGSRALVGSSMSSTSGCVAKARAMHRRCCWPPESPRPDWPSLSRTSSHRPASRRHFSTSSSASARPTLRMRRGPYRMLSRMDMGNGLGCWNTMPTLTRSSLASPLKMSRPATSMTPSVRTVGTKSHMRLKVRSSVDLPQPEGPMNAVARFFGMSSVTPLSAWNSPYHRLKSRMEIMGASAWACAPCSPVACSFSKSVI